MFKCIKAIRTIKKGELIKSESVTQDFGRTKFYTIEHQGRNYILSPKAMWEHFVIVPDKEETK